MRLLKVLAIILLVVGLLVMLAPGVGALSQTWFFTNVVSPPPIWTAPPRPPEIVDVLHRQMTKGVEGANVFVRLWWNESIWFYSDEVALVDVPFPAGSWDVSYWIGSIAFDVGRRLVTRLHGISSAGVRLSPAAGYVQALHTITTPHLEEVRKTLHAPSFTIPTGGRFAIEVRYYEPDVPVANWSDIHVNPPGLAVSRVISPPTDPGYPIPELPTIILFSMGLLLLGGYVWLKRRRACLQPQS